MKYVAKCNFDCGFLKRKAGEQVSAEKAQRVLDECKDAGDLIECKLGENVSEPSSELVKESSDESEEVFEEIKPKKKGKK